MDVEDAYREFIRCNPGLEQTFQSAAQRGRNLWVRIEGEYPRTFVLSSPNTGDGEGKKTAIGEFRSTGSQTIVFGKHPSGVYYKWLKDGGVLRLRYDQINWPPAWRAPKRDDESRRSKGSAPIQQQTGRTGSAESETRSTEQRLYLPNAHVTIPESADALFRLIAPSLTMFKHGRRIVEPVARNGRIELEQINPDGFRGRIQKFGAFFTKQPDAAANYLTSIGHMRKLRLKSTRHENDAAPLLHHRFLTAHGLRSWPPQRQQGSLTARHHHQH